MGTSSLECAISAIGDKINGYEGSYYARALSSTNVPLDIALVPVDFAVCLLCAFPLFNPEPLSNFLDSHFSHPLNEWKLRGYRDRLEMLSHIPGANAENFGILWDDFTKQYTAIDAKAQRQVRGRLRRVEKKYKKQIKAYKEAQKMAPTVSGMPKKLGFFRKLQTVMHWKSSSEQHVHVSKEDAVSAAGNETTREAGFLAQIGNKQEVAPSVSPVELINPDRQGPVSSAEPVTKPVEQTVRARGEPTRGTGGHVAASSVPAGVVSEPTSPAAQGKASGVATAASHDVAEKPATQGLASGKGAYGTGGRRGAVRSPRRGTRRMHHRTFPKNSL